MISGRVVDSVAGNALPGATVYITGASLITSTDISGAFRITGVPAGKQLLEISYLGYESQSIQIDVQAGETVDLQVLLETLSKDTATVYAEPYLEGQAKALNQQKTAINIKNIVSADQIGSFPDPNAAEATQRITGITLQRDQGEGRFVIIRGSEPRLTNSKLNGVNLPAPEGDIRYVALDVIPANILEAIEVSKALTPDMDADAIGGSVNLITKRAPERPLLAGGFGFGYNDINGDGLETFNVTAGKRFNDGRLGIIFATSFLNTNRGSENFEVEYDDGYLEELDVRHYTVNRKRFGLVAGLDYRFENNSEIYLRGNFNQFGDQEYRRRVVNKVGDGEIERELKDRYERQRIYSIAGGGRHFFDNLLQLDYELSYAYAEEEEPNRLDSIFLQEDVEFDPNVTPDNIDPDNIQANPLNEDLSEFILDEAIREDNLTTDKDFVGYVNLSRPFTSGSDTGGLWKTGFKFRHKNKNRDNNAFVFESDDDVSLVPNLVDPDFNVGKVVKGRYEIGRHVGPNLVRGLVPDLEGEKDIEEDLGDYEAEEDILAGYGLIEFNLSPRAQLLPGVRIEHTDMDYTGRELIIDEEGDIASISPVEGKNKYTDALPMIHFKYRLSNNSNLRAAFTRTLSRPNHVDIVPTQLLNQEDREIERGNPLLKPTRSWNFDLMGEHYFQSVGVLSAGIFYKKMKDHIFITVTEEEREGEEYEVTSPQNLETAELFGFESAFQNQFHFLPGVLSGIGVYANYTYVWSDANLPGRQGRLPGQAKNIYNIALFYEKYGFSGRLSWNFHDDYLAEVADDPLEDVFIDRHLQMDLLVSQRITRNVSVFAEFINLSNEPLRAYEGQKDRPIQEEYYSWWGTFGMKFNF
jgi:TonB-dependent receptor